MSDRTTETNKIDLLAMQTWQDSKSSDRMTWIQQTSYFKNIINRSGITGVDDAADLVILFTYADYRILPSTLKDDINKIMPKNQSK